MLASNSLLEALVVKKAIVVRTGGDRLRYSFFFELVLVAILAPAGALVLDRRVLDVGLLALVLSFKAMLFNMIYNWVFDQMDVRAGRIPTKRSFMGRLLHAVGFECGLVMTSLPIVMWWLGLTLWQALMMDLAVTSLIVVYTMAFGWSYDRLFPLSQPSTPGGA